VEAALSIADSSLNAERTAIAVTAENVSNAKTPGYVRESATLTSVPGDSSGVGAGVAVSTVAQATNALLSANNYQAQGTLSNLTSAQQILTAIENVFPLGQGASGSTSSSTNSSLAGQLSSFWSNWDNVNADPSAPAPRSQIIQSAQGIVQSLNEAATQLSQIGANASAELGNQVESLNSLLTQAASLNQSILTVSTGGGDPAQLKDQMNAVLGQLSQYAGVTVRTQANGTSNVGISGVNVVAGNLAATLSVTNASGTTTLVASPGGIATPVTSGSIAGLLSGINQFVPQYRAQLDAVANSLATTVNTQLAAGYTASGTSGATEPLFVGAGAQNIALNAAVVADPTLIAAASSTGTAATNDGSNAQAMAELGISPSGPDVAYQNLIQSVGSATQSVISQVGAQSSVANQAQAALASSSGVNLDTELTNLMSYQQNYEASAKLLTTISQAMQSLIAAV
jgi:flagellar hook-associated protein 1 FlgK